MGKPLVSVIVPICNDNKRLEKKIWSLEKSIYQNTEVIMTDYASNPGTENITAQFAKNKYIFLQNTGITEIGETINNAIQKSNGKYILPLVSDILTAPDYIEKAVDVLEKNDNVKIVGSNEKDCKLRQIKYPKFSLKKLAQKNIIGKCAIFRKTDWERAGGYSNVPDESWDFWISIIKNDGDFVRLNTQNIYYKNTETIDKQKLEKTIDELNKRHKCFIYKQLGGKLHYKPALSVFFNFFTQMVKHEKFFTNEKFMQFEDFIYNLPENFTKSNIILHKGRNTIKILSYKNTEIVVKLYEKPNILNKFVYGFIRKSKARRSYEYALDFLKHGILTPMPIGFYEKKKFFLFDKSYFACLKSTCPHKFADLIREKKIPDRDEMLKEFAKFTAYLHEKGYCHLDYSAGNILFGEENGKIRIEIIDLNRMKFGKVNLKNGCRNFERLNIDAAALKLIAQHYAKARNFDEQICTENILKMRWKKHKNERNL